MLDIQILAASKNPVDVISLAAGTSYDKENVSEKRVESCVKSRHTSVLEHASATFRIDGISRACYDKDTDILTETGWRPISEMRVGDVVVTLDPETQKVKLDKVISTTSYLYNGDLYRFNSADIDLAVTPNHNMWVNTDGAYGSVAAEALDAETPYEMTKGFIYDRELPESFVSPLLALGSQGAVGIVPDHGEVLAAPRKELYTVLAYFLSIGYPITSPADLTKIGIGFNSVPEDAILKLTGALDAMSVNYALAERFIPVANGEIDLAIESGRALQVESTDLGRWLYTMTDTYGTTTLGLDPLKDFTPDLARDFLKDFAAAAGTPMEDGHIKLTTSSEALLDELYTLCLVANFSVKRQEAISSANGVVPLVSHTVVAEDNGGGGSFTVQPKYHVSKEAYNDVVSCVEVPSHVIFVRRGGKSCWCGNCSHQLVRHRLASFVQQSQRYVKIDTSNNDWYVTPPSILKGPDSIRQAYDNQMRQNGIVYQSLIQDKRFGVRAEDARYLLPNACKTNLTMTMNVRELFSFLNLRLSKRAQWEIRELAEEIQKTLAAHSDQWKFLMDLYERYQDIIN